MTSDQPARITLVSPVLTLLGGVSPDGMVCDVNGVCAPADASAVDDSSTVGERQ